MTTTTRTLPPGVYPYGNGGYRAVAKVGPTKQDRQEKTFPAGTPPRVITTWQETTRTALRTRDKSVKGSFLDELPRYLTRRSAMGMHAAGLAQRETELRAMFAILGPTKSRADIGYDQIVDMLIALKTAGRAARTRPGKAGGEVKAGGRVVRQLGNGTIRCYKNALQNFYTVLGGRSAANPVKDVQLKTMFPERTRKKPPVISFDLLDQILDAMTDIGGPATRGEKRSLINLTRIRLRLIAFAGLPQQQIRELEPDDIDWEGRRVFVGRNKGAGLDGRWVHRGDFAMDALRAFADAGGFGDFSSSSMHKAFCLARDKVAPGSTVTPYKLRHLFANASLDAGADEQSASRINLHASEATSRIYRETAEGTRDRAAWNAIDSWHRAQGRRLASQATADAANAGIRLDQQVGRKRKAAVSS